VTQIENVFLRRHEIALGDTSDLLAIWTEVESPVVASALGRHIDARNWIEIRIAQCFDECRIFAQLRRGEVRGYRDVHSVLFRHRRKCFEGTMQGVRDPHHQTLVQTRFGETLRVVANRIRVVAEQREKRRYRFGFRSSGRSS
jgi:hypothetical protein